MTIKSFLCVAALVACGACGKKGAADGKGDAGTATAPARGGGTAAAPAGQPAGGGAGAGAAGSAGQAPVPTAAGGEVAGLTAVTDCPKSLGGHERVARTLTKACGPVTVTGDYSLDGQLTLEAGTVLKLTEGATLWVGRNETSKLIVKGTVAEPVVLASAGDAVPGFWRGAGLGEHAARSQIENLVIENAGDDRGMLRIQADDVSIKGLRLKGGKELGLWLDDGVKLAELSGAVFEKPGKLAMSLTTPAVAGLRAGGKFDADTPIEVRSGDLDTSAKWQNPGAPLVFRRTFQVGGKAGKATLEIAAGTELRFDAGVGMDVGYDKPGALVVAGTGDQPVRFVASDEAQPWRGVFIYNGADVKLDNAVFSGGGTDENRGMVFVDQGVVSVTSCAFRKYKLGLSAGDHPDSKLTIVKTTFDGGEQPAVLVAASLVGGLGAGNTFAKDAHIAVRGSEVKGSPTWTPQGVPFEITGEVAVDRKGVLTLAAGVELAFGKDQQLSVGYNAEAALKIAGTAEKPVKLRGEHDEAESWKGVVFYEHARDSELANVRLEGTAGAAGVQVQDGATVKIDTLVCARCANAAVSGACKAKLTATNLRAEGGTPKEQIKPEGCP